MAQTNVVINRDPLADFLRDIPKLIFEAKAYGEELTWKENQAELNREHELDIAELSWSRDMLKDVYGRYQEQQDSLATLGLISEAQQSLNGTQQSAGFQTFEERMEGAYSGGTEELANLITDIDSSMGANRSKIAAFETGKNMFGTIDINEDGFVDTTEITSYMEENQGTITDTESFMKGVYAGEPTLEQRVTIAGKQQDLVTKEFQNKYMDESLANEIAIQDKTILTMGKDITLKTGEIKQQNQDFALGKLQIDNAELVNRKLEEEIIINQTTFDSEQTQIMKASLIDQQARDKINAQSTALKLFAGTFLYGENNTVVSMYDLMIEEDGVIKDLDFEGMLQIGDDFHLTYKAYEDAFGVAASIEGDMLGLFKSLSMGWDNTTGTMINTQPFLAAADAIWDEANQLVENNAAVNMSFITGDLKGDFEEEYLVGAYDHPKEFIIYVQGKMEDAGLDMSELELIGLARYMQFKQAGILEGDMLKTNRKLLDNVNKSDALLEKLTSQELDNFELLKNRERNQIQSSPR